MKCKHRRATAWAWWKGKAWYAFSREVDGRPGKIICDSCGHWLGLGEANDTDERVRIEKDLADALAEANTGEWTIDGLDVDDLEGGAIDAMLDIDFARQLAAEARRGRPRSPIEMMVDRACGIAAHDQTHGGE